MKLLYISCHSILEYDEVRLFQEMGLQVFALGAYLRPAEPQASGRPALASSPWHDEIFECWQTVQSQVGPDRVALPKFFVDRFDAIVVMGMTRTITCNQDSFRNKAVIWRTIGQSGPATENELRPYRETFKIVRYSPKEMNIPDNLGCDALIRFYKDPEEYGSWNGRFKVIMAACNSLRPRAQSCNYGFWQAIKQSSRYPVSLFGNGNSDLPESAGCPPVEGLIAALRDSAAYVSLGTHPASYTLNFIEAWMTGIPVLAVGPRLGDWAYDLYEVPNLISKGENGYWADSVDEAIDWLHAVVDDKNLAHQISAAGRSEAIRIFGKELAMDGWRSLFQQL